MSVIAVVRAGCEALRVRSGLFVFLASILAAPTPCAAHAVVVEAIPQQGATVTRAPDQVVLRFNVRIEQKLARVTLRSGNGTPMALAPLHDSASRADRIVVPLPPLGAGEHEVRYRVLATDGHATQGVLRFRVAP